MRPKKPEADRKTTRLAIRLTPAERLQIEQAARKAGLSISDYLRAQALAGQVTVHHHRTLDHDAFDQLRRIGVNLNQLTRLTHETGGLPAELASCLAALENLFAQELSGPAPFVIPIDSPLFPAIPAMPTASDPDDS